MTPAMAMVEGALVTVGARPAVDIGVALPKGARLAFSREEARVPGRGLQDPNVVLLLHQAADGTAALTAPVEGRRARVWLADAEGELASWTLDHVPTTVVEVDGRWMIRDGQFVEVRDRDGAVVARTEVSCPQAEFGAYAVDGGLRGICHASAYSWTVGVDGAIGDNADTLTLASGAVLEIGRPNHLARSGPDGLSWTAVLQPRAFVVGSPDGRYVLAGDRVLDADNGEEVARRPFSGWTSDGDLVVRSGRVTIVYDPATGIPRSRSDGHLWMADLLSWSDDGRRLASVGSDGVAFVWDAHGGPPMARLEVGEGVRSLELADDAVLVGLPGGAFARWVPGEPAPRYTAEGRPTSLGDGRVAVASEQGVTVLDPDGNELSSWQSPLPGEFGRPAVTQVAVVSGRLLAVSAARLWDVERSEPVALGVARVQVTQDGEAALICDGTRTTGSWPPGRTGEVAGCVHRELGAMGVEQTATAISPDGRRRAVASPDGSIAIVPTTYTVVRDRAPRDVIVVGSPADLPDPERLLTSLQVAHVRGDRVTWIVPGAPDPPWIEVHDKHAAAAFAALADQPGDGDTQAGTCRGQQLLADGGGTGVVVVMATRGAPGNCPAGRDTDTRFASGTDAILSVVRPGW